MLCNMDKNVFRSFSLRIVEDSKRGPIHLLQMHSSIEGEYGPINFLISAELEVDQPKFFAVFLDTSGASQADLHNFRVSEILYFVSRILPLFNPLTVFHDEVPFPPAPVQTNP